MNTLLRPPRSGLIAGTLLIAVLAVLLCLIPKPENDLFFELRVGTDILNTGHLPHVDTYSWTNRGTRWDVPEWLAFTLFALAYRAGGFFGTWLLMALLTVATAWVVWFWLARRTGLMWAFGLTNLTLLALRDCLQERPYTFTNLLLALALVVVTRAREDRPRLLFWLPPLCTLWANLHQGVLVFVCLLFVYTAADAVSAVWQRIHATPPDLLTPEGREASECEPWRRQSKLSLQMLGIGVACAGATLISPYGWRIVWDVLITLRDPNLTVNITEWNHAWTLPLAQIQPFLLLSLISIGTLALSTRRRFADAVILLILCAEGWLHARNIPLFALASAIITAPHAADCAGKLRQHWGAPPPSRRIFLAAFALFYIVAVGAASLTSLRRAIGPRGYTLAGIGEAVARVPDYPEGACAFMDTAHLPSRLRLLNDFETGGYLMWRLPREPVFIDGRGDVYVGQTFDNMLVLARAPGTPAWTALVRRYNFDCVITSSKSEAQAFAADPGWQLVYISLKQANGKRTRVLLRRGIINDSGIIEKPWKSLKK